MFGRQREQPHVLRALGLGDDGNFTDEAVHAECMRIARRLRVADRRVVGLLPAAPDIAVPPVGVRLGLAQVQLSGATVAYVDANVRLPALSEIAQRDSADHEDTVYSTRWIFDSLALLTPRAAERAGEVIPQLAGALREGSLLFHYMYVDLTGFDLIGEHAAAAELMDSVIVVGRAGRTKEAELRYLRDQLGRSFLGVLLVG